MHLKTTLLLATGLFAGTTFAQQFLQSDVVEFAISECGTYAANTPPPAGYHPNVSFGTGFGIVADPDQDGWETGSPTLYCGDYVYPGSPVEGFSLQVGNQYKKNSAGFLNCDDAQILPTSLSTGNFGDFRIAVWTGTAGAGISVRQSTMTKVGEAMMIQRVKICNNSSSDLDSVFYQRFLDPDPEQPWSGGFATRNIVIDPSASGSGVEASGLTFDNCRIALISPDDRSQGSFGGFNGDKPSLSYFGQGAYSNSGSNVADNAVQLTFYMGSIAAGQCDCAAYAYVFKREDYGRATAITNLACSAFDLFEEDEDAEQLASRIFGTNHFEDHASIQWLAIPGGFQLQNLGAGDYVEVYDLSGRLVHNQFCSTQAYAVTGLAAGLYVVQIRDQQGQVRSGKATVQ